MKRLRWRSRSLPEEVVVSASETAPVIVCRLAGGNRLLVELGQGRLAIYISPDQTVLMQHGALLHGLLNVAEVKLIDEGILENPMCESCLFHLEGHLFSMLSTSGLWRPVPASRARRFFFSESWSRGQQEKNLLVRGESGHSVPLASNNLPATLLFGPMEAARVRVRRLRNKPSGWVRYTKNLGLEVLVDARGNKIEQHGGLLFALIWGAFTWMEMTGTIERFPSPFYVEGLVERLFPMLAVSGLWRGVSAEEASGYFTCGKSESEESLIHRQAANATDPGSRRLTPRGTLRMRVVTSFSACAGRVRTFTRASAPSRADAREPFKRSRRRKR